MATALVSKQSGDLAVADIMADFAKFCCSFRGVIDFSQQKRYNNEDGE
jgi:hypothetical protein